MASFSRGKRYIAGGIAAFLLACWATAKAMVWVIQWALANCVDNSPACRASIALIDYWWLLFVPAVLAATLLVHRGYARRIQVQDRQAG